MYFGRCNFGRENVFIIAVLFKSLLLKRSIPWNTMTKRTGKRITGFRTTRFLFSNKLEIYYYENHSRKSKKEKEGNFPSLTPMERCQLLTQDEPENIPVDNEYSLTYTIN